MDKLQNVINELVEYIESALSVDSDYVDHVRTDLLQTVVRLLKAQEPVSPNVDIDTYVCGACGMQLERQSLIGPNAVLSETFDYCPSCGKKVNWNG